MLTNSQKEEIIYHLNSWISGVTPETRHWGICGNLEDFLGVNVVKQLDVYFKSWDKFSGDLECPIPGGLLLFVTTTNKFDFTIPYNQDRRDLMIHIVSEMEEELGI